MPKESYKSAKQMGVERRARIGKNLKSIRGAIIGLASSVKKKVKAMPSRNEHGITMMGALRSFTKSKRKSK